MTNPSTRRLRLGTATFLIYNCNNNHCLLHSSIHSLKLCVDTLDSHAHRTGGWETIFKLLAI